MREALSVQPHADGWIDPCAGRGGAAASRPLRLGAPVHRDEDVLEVNATVSVEQNPATHQRRATRFMTADAGDRFGDGTVDPSRTIRDADGWPAQSRNPSSSARSPMIPAVVRPRRSALCTSRPRLRPGLSNCRAISPAFEGFGRSDNVPVDFLRVGIRVKNVEFRSGAQGEA